MSDDGLRLSDVAASALILLANVFAVATLVALLIHRYRSPIGWATALGYCRWGLVLLGLLGAVAVVAVFIASRNDSAYAYFIYPTLLASSVVMFCAALALPLKP